MLRYHNITNHDMLNGEGLRAVLWLAHCDFNCKGCQNPQTHDKNGGLSFGKKAKKELFGYLAKEEIQGVTLSGGDPLSSVNRFESLKLIAEIKDKFPGKDVWVYTGYKWEDVKNLDGIGNIDVLVDGNYVEKLNFPSPQWRGSTNQRLIDVKSSIALDRTIEAKI